MESSRRWRIEVGVLWLVSPLATAAAIHLLSPMSLQELVARYTDRGVVQSMLPNSTLRDYWEVAVACAEAAGVETLARVYNVWAPALLSAAVWPLVPSSQAPWCVGSSAQANSTVWEALAFTALSAVVAVSLSVPSRLAWVELASLIFLLNFPLARNVLLEGDSRWTQAARYAIAATAFTGLVHFLAPVWLLRSWQQAGSGPIPPAQGESPLCWGASSRAQSPCRWFASGLSRAKRSRSRRTRECLLSGKEFYDIVLDPQANRLIVTTKNSPMAQVLCLDTLERQASFPIDSGEVEDIEFDAERRELYHVDRRTGKVLVLGADDFRELRRGYIPRESRGSVKLALDHVSNRLVVSFENDNLFAVDRDTFDCKYISRPGNMNLLADRRNELVYLNLANLPNVWAVDFRAIRKVVEATAPVRNERMVLSETRQELYLPDPAGGKIWVYSTPKLELLRTIDADLGSRTLTLDADRGLLLAASVVSGYVRMIDIESGETLQRHYVGKYARMIQLDPSRRRAFLTLMKDGLYVLDY